MEKLLSNGVNNQTIPQSYVVPPEKRPGNAEVSACKTIPVIDLQRGLGGADGNKLQPFNRREIIDQIVKAGKEFGFFQVINHGVPTQAIMNVAEEFFEMSAEDKAAYYSEDPTKPCRLFNSSGQPGDVGYFWRDCLYLSCYPMEEYKHLWPDKPSKLRESLASFTMEARDLALWLLKLIGEGLGPVDDNLMADISSGNVTIYFNHYAACPDPSLTLGLPGHCDPKLITLLLQGDISGLQVFHEGRWMGVEPIPNAFVVNFGQVLEVITNGMLRSAEHRVVTNSATKRTSIATFLEPEMDFLVAPAQSFVDEHNPPLYKSILYKDFQRTVITYRGDKKLILESLMRKNNDI